MSTRINPQHQNTKETAHYVAYVKRKLTLFIQQYDETPTILTKRAGKAVLTCWLQQRK